MPAISFGAGLAARDAGPGETVQARTVRLSGKPGSPGREEGGDGTGAAVLLPESGAGHVRLPMEELRVASRSRWRDAERFRLKQVGVVHVVRPQEIAEAVLVQAQVRAGPAGEIGLDPGAQSGSSCWTAERRASAQVPERSPGEAGEDEWSILLHRTDFVLDGSAKTSVHHVFPNDARMHHTTV